MRRIGPSCSDKISSLTALSLTVDCDRVSFGIGRGGLSSAILAWTTRSKITQLTSAETAS
jgi:hypothetical protein